MAVKASATITISAYRDTDSITRYYKLQASTLTAPSKPTTNPPSGWSDAEPAYSSGSTNTLYFCDLMIFSDGTWQYTTVSKSSSYEAAKEAYNKATSVETELNDLEIGGRNLFLNTDTIYENNTYRIATYKPANGPLVVGEIYTVTICVTPAENLSYISLYFSGGYVSLASLHFSGTSKQTVSKTFTMRYHSERTPDVSITYANADFYRFPNDGTITSNSIVHWVKIEKGNRATDWTPAPEDMATKTEVTEAAKTATNFFTITDEDGLVVGNLTAGTLRGNIQLKAETSGASISLRDGTTNLAKFIATSKAFTGVTSATTSTSSDSQSEEGESGTTSGTVTGASQTIVSNQTTSVVKFESSQPIYFSQGIRTNGITVNDDSLISNVPITLNGRIFDKNGKSAFEPYTGDGNLSIGYGRFKSATSSSTDWTILYGNKVKIATKNGACITQDGSLAFETYNSNGNASFGYHLRKKGSGDLNLYGGTNVNIKAANVSISDSTGSSCFDAKNSNGNTVIGYARYSNGGNTNIYAGSELNLIAASGGNVISNSSIMPDSNASLALGKYNEKGWSNIYIGNASGVYNGLRMILDGSSQNLCGRDADGHYIYGNNGSIMYYYVKNVSETATGTGFRFTSGNFDAGNNTVSTWLFGAADSTSRYMGSYLAYNRTYSSAANMFVTANGVFGRSTSSSKRYKTDITDAGISELKSLYDLPVKKFKYRKDYISEDDELYDKFLYGFVVDDLEDILPCAVQHISDENGNMLPEMWNSNIIVPALLKLVQDLNERVDILEKKGETM